MQNLPPSDIVLHALSLVALAAQAMTAALAAGRRSMDWVGVCLLGAITALGGGTIFATCCSGIIRWCGWKTRPISRSPVLRPSPPS
jgi:glycine transporter